MTRPIIRVVRAATGAALVLVAIAALWPTRWGGRTTLVIVSGHSMEPTYHTGDLLYAWQGRPEPGDIAVYKVPAGEPGAGGRVVHRLVERLDDGQLVFRGDHNSSNDPWHPSDQHVTGIVRWHVPWVGRIVVWLLSPWPWLAVGLLIVAYVLWPGREPAGDKWPAPDASARVETDTPAPV